MQWLLGYFGIKKRFIRNDRLGFITLTNTNNCIRNQLPSSAVISCTDTNLNETTHVVDLQVLRRINKNRPEAFWGENKGDIYLAFRYLLSKSAVPLASNSSRFMRMLSSPYREFRNFIFKTSFERQLTNKHGTITLLKYPNTTSNDFFTLKKGVFNVSLKDNEPSLLLKLVERYNEHLISSKADLDKKIEIQGKKLTGYSPSWENFITFLSEEKQQNDIKNSVIQEHAQSLISIQKLQNLEDDIADSEKLNSTVNALDKVLEFINCSVLELALSDSNEDDLYVHKHMRDLSTKIEAYKYIIQNYSHKEGFWNLIDSESQTQKMKTEIDFLLLLRDAILSGKTIQSSGFVRITSIEALNIMACIKMQIKNECIKSRMDISNIVNAISMTNVSDVFAMSTLTNHKASESQFAEIYDIISHWDPTNKDHGIIEKFVSKLSEAIATLHESSKVVGNISEIRLIKSKLLNIDKFKKAHSAIMKVPVLRTILCPTLNLIMRKIRSGTSSGTVFNDSTKCFPETTISSKIRSALNIQKSSEHYHLSKRFKKKDLIAEFRVKVKRRGFLGYLYKAKAHLNLIRRKIFRNPVFKFLTLGLIITAQILYRYSHPVSILGFATDIVSSALDVIVIICVLDVVMDATIFSLFEKASPIIKLIDDLLFRGLISLIGRNVKNLFLFIYKNLKNVPSAVSSVVKFGFITSIQSLLLKARRSSDNLRQVNINLGTTSYVLSQTFSNPEIYSEGIERRLDFSARVDFFRTDELLIHEAILEQVKFAKDTPLTPETKLRLLNSIVRSSSGEITSAKNERYADIINQLSKKINFSNINLANIDRQEQVRALHCIKFLQEELSRSFNHDSKLGAKTTSYEELKFAEAKLKLIYNSMKKLLTSDPSTRETIIATEGQIRTMMQDGSNEILLSFRIARINSTLENLTRESSSIGECINNKYISSVLITPKPYYIEKILSEIKSAKCIKGPIDGFLHFIRHFLNQNVSIRILLLTNGALNVLKLFGFHEILKNIDKVTSLPTEKVEGLFHSALGIDIDSIFLSNPVSKGVITFVYQNSLLVRDIFVDAHCTTAALTNMYHANNLDQLLEKIEKKRGEIEDCYSTTTGFSDLMQGFLDLIFTNSFINELPSGKPITLEQIIAQNQANTLQKSDDENTATETTTPSSMIKIVKAPTIITNNAQLAKERSLPPTMTQQISYNNESSTKRTSTSTKTTTQSKMVKIAKASTITNNAQQAIDTSLITPTVAIQQTSNTGHKLIEDIVASTGCKIKIITPSKNLQKAHSSLILTGVPMGNTSAIAV